MKETLFIFLQGIPDDLNAGEIEAKIVEIENVNSIHHTHIWSLEGEHHVFTSHVKLENIKHFDELITVKNQIKSVLQNYHFEHYTVETELDNETCALDK